jgi:hypothetical protein
MTKTPQEIENQKTVVQADLTMTRQMMEMMMVPKTSEDSDHPDEENVQHNLADTIGALARNVQHQGDGSHSKVQEPDC